MSKPRKLYPLRRERPSLPTTFRDSAVSFLKRGAVAEPGRRYLRLRERLHLPVDIPVPSPSEGVFRKIHQLASKYRIYAKLWWRPAKE